MSTDRLYFEENGEELLKRNGLTKSEFARRMGIKKQNVNILFKTKNVITLRKVSETLGVPFDLLVSYANEPDLM